MNRLITECVGTGLLLASATAFAAEVRGNVALGTDYVFRGLSKSL